MSYLILIPKTEGRIAPGSGIVASLCEGRDAPFYKIFFEGNIYGAVNVNAIEEKLMIAAYRLKDNAPTVAKLYLPVDFLEQDYWVVGCYDLESKQIDIDPDKQDQWNSWINRAQEKEV